jgi:hypothetical protein
MGKYADAKIMRMSELESFCPPKHVDTDSWTMVTEDLGVSRFVRGERTLLFHHVWRRRGSSGG